MTRADIEKIDGALKHIKDTEISSRIAVEVVRPIYLPIDTNVKEVTIRFLIEENEDEKETRTKPTSNI